jgi:hypothetical protein
MGKLSKSEIRRLDVQLEGKSEEEKDQIKERVIYAKLGGEIVARALVDLEDAIDLPE